MAVTTSARNFNYFSYVSDDGTTYNLKGDATWGAAAASGGTAAGSHPAYGRASRRRSPRKAIFRDAASFRTFTGTVYTTAAFTALNIGSSTVSRQLPGASTAVTFTLIKKVAEKIPTTVIGRTDPQDTLAA